MVGSSYIDIHTLTMDELAGVVNLYPWYGAARVELCRRMARMGEDWGEEQYAAEALYVPDRSKLAVLVRKARTVDCSDKDLTTLLSSYLEPSAGNVPETPMREVRVVGGDYFSQAQYDNVRQSGDSIFSRFAGKAGRNTPPEDMSGSEMANRFATETLARIFEEQGRTEEARRIYSRLILEIPEKSAYFASLIENLDK
ncbi:MAG: hypothetical protein IJQ35_02945 [Bacteroidales bacterium]|jgi:hypothetical protein|nr:hypothetical protein [Bacteroidales bacterium]